MGAKYVFNPLTGNLDTTDVVAFNGEVDLGTAAAPSIFFTGDPNTGIYSPGADQVAISTNGTGRLFVDASGNVGINVAAGGATGFGNGFIKSKAVTGVPGLFLENSNGASWWGVYGGSSLADSAALVYPSGGSLRVATTTGSSVAGFSEKLRITSDGKVGLGTSSPSELLEVSADPISIIKVTAGTSGSNSARRATLKLLAGGSKEFNLTADASDSSFKILDGTTPRLTIDSSGRVGIGTTSPAQLLHLNSPSADATQWIAAGSGYTSNLSLLANGSGGGLVLSSLTNSSASITNTLNESLAFGTNNTERARIDTSGKLLVGTSSGSADARAVFQATSSSTTQKCIMYFQRGATNPTANQDLAFLYFADSAQSVGATIQTTTDGNWASGDYPTRLVFSTTAAGASSPTERMRIQSDGKIRLTNGVIYASNVSRSGISLAANAWIPTNNTGTNSDNTVSLGTASVRMSVIYAATGTINTSDANLKQDIGDLDAAELSVATAIRGLIRRYRFKDAVEAKGDNARIHVGVVAQEVEQAFVDSGLDPRRYALFCEDELEDGTKRLGIRYDELLAFVIAAL